jgi:hypothetical protein
MGTLLLTLEDADGTRRVATADGDDYAEDMRLLNVMRVRAEMNGWRITRVKRNGRTFAARDEEEEG